MRLIFIVLMSFIFISCNKKVAIPADTSNKIETAVLSEEESRLLCDEIIRDATDSESPILLLVSNIKESPLWENDRKRLLENHTKGIILTENWSKATVQIESARMDESVGIVIPVLYGESGGSMRVTYQFTNEHGSKMIVPGVMSTIFRVVTHE